MHTRIFYFLILLLPFQFIRAQDDTLKIISGNDSGNPIKDSLHNFPRAYQYLWLGSLYKNRISNLKSLLDNSEELGLNPEDYENQFSKLSAGISGQILGTADSLRADIGYTDLAIHFFRDIALGNKPEKFSFDGLQYVPPEMEIANKVVSGLAHGAALADMVTAFEPADASYRSVKKLLQQYLQLSREEGFQDLRVGPATGKEEWKEQLWNRFVQLGIVQRDSEPASVTDLGSAVRHAQNFFGQLEDGVVHPSLLKALNLPLKDREVSLKRTLNSLRWQNSLKKAGDLLVVNIPSASLELFDSGKIILESRIIAGKKSTPTPLVSGKITEVILYPYWNVPYSIATREFLPAIKRSVSFLTANNFQVLDSKGRVVNPYQVDWQSLSAGHFPYYIRQSTGCDNSLGLIKLNFYNPFNVYLHDTPVKMLFSSSSRFFSHGCMRVEKAGEVARYLLKSNAIAVDTLTEKGCLKNQHPILVPVMVATPVLVLYQTAWADAGGRVRFFEDIYQRFPKSGK